MKLGGLLRRAVEGSGRVVFVTGEPGIGRSAPVGEFLRRARGEHPGLIVKALVGGNFHSVNGVSRPNFARLNANGTLDATFDPDASVSTVYSMLAQPDGKVIVTGGGVGELAFTVMLSGLTDRFVSFTARAFSGTAVVNEDFFLPGTQFFISPEAGSARVSVNVLGDTVAEPDEGLTLRISDPQGAALGDAEGAGTIRDNETSTGPPTVQFSVQLEANKQAFLNDFVRRPQVAALYPPELTAEQFVDALAANTGDPLNPGAGPALTPAERAQLAAGLASGARTRAQVLRAVAENEEFKRRQFNKAFVWMQYVGYLRRGPNEPPDANFDGYNFWLGKLNDFGGDFVRAEMVRAFLESIEYRRRFGQ